MDCLGVGGDVVGVGLQVGLDRLGAGHVLQQLLGAVLVLELAAQHEAVDRRLHRVLGELRVDLREGEEVEVVLVRALELLAHEHAEQEHGGLLLRQRGGGLLPLARQAALEVVVGKDLRPVVEGRLDPGVGPRLLAVHQVDVELVAVGAHVDVVEGPHHRPAAVVGHGQRGQPVLLLLLEQGDVLVPGLGRLVVVLLEDALPVEDRPGVVVERHEVLLAVAAGGGRLQGVGEVGPDLLPHVGDRGRQPLLREEVHAVAGEPEEHVLRGALKVAVDVLLERVVVDGVDLDVEARGSLCLGEHVDVGLLGDGVGGVGPDRHHLAGGPTATALAAPTGGKDLREGDRPGGHTEQLEQVAPVHDGGPGSARQGRGGPR